MLKEWAYFETASTGLIPDFVYDGVRRYMDGRYYRGGDSVWHYADGDVSTLEMMQRSKKAMADMIHANPEDIAFGQSSTQMFTMITEGIDYAPGDNIVTVGDGWIGGRYAWQKRQSEGLEVRFVGSEKGAVTPEMLLAECDEHTRVVSVNLVESTTGYRIDIDKLGAWCSAHGVLLAVDAVQALGVLNVDVTRGNIDFLVGNDYKWMMNFCGTGYAYVAPKVRAVVKHWGVGWMSDTDRFNTAKKHIDLRSDAGRYEIGHQSTDGIYGLGLVAAQAVALGQENIENYVMELADYFRQRAEETDGVELSYEFPRENCSQIISIRLEPQVRVSDADFQAAKVFAHVGDADGAGRREIRVGLHYYNNQEDIDRFFAVIDNKKK
ncbi:MAG: aminotransferase class V-fold PLP-dependent enzyme [Acutalibacter sp.]